MIFKIAICYIIFLVIAFLTLGVFTGPMPVKIFFGFLMPLPILTLISVLWDD